MIRQGNQIKFETPKDVSGAIGIQRKLAGKVMLRGDVKNARIIAGLDVGYDYKKNLSKAAITLFRNEEIQPFLSAFAFSETPFPYISGLLSFREIPVILDLFKCIPVFPDLVFVDGQGIAHPRRLGLHHI